LTFDLDTPLLHVRSSGLPVVHLATAVMHDLSRKSGNEFLSALPAQFDFELLLVHLSIL
jgi:hypothetical protein